MSCQELTAHEWSSLGDAAEDQQLDGEDLMNACRAGHNVGEQRRQTCQRRMEVLGCWSSSAEEEEEWCEAGGAFWKVFSACGCSAELWQERGKGQLQGAVFIVFQVYQ